MDELIIIIEFASFVLKSRRNRCVRIDGCYSSIRAHMLLEWQAEENYTIRTTPSTLSAQLYFFSLEGPNVRSPCQAMIFNWKIFSENLKKTDLSLQYKLSLYS